jgi:hypothetical protein
MDRLRQDIRAVFSRQQEGLEDLDAARRQVFRNALDRRSAAAGSRTQLFGGIAAVLIAALVVATFAYFRAGNRTHSVVPPTPTASPSSKFSAVAPIHNNVVDGLHCKLPVYLSGAQGSGGFISFPDGRVASDDTSNVVTPGGYWFGLTYDSAVKRWLPVPATWVSPDGTVYFFAEPRSDKNAMLFEVNAQTGTSAELGISPLGYGWQVIAVTTDYVFAKLLTHPGLYIMPISDPYSKQMTEVTSGFWSAASGVYVFGTPVPDGGAIQRIDARKQGGNFVMDKPPAGAEPWFNKSNSAQILGVDGSGNPVIWTGTEMWIATGPDQATRISTRSPLPITTSQGAPINGANAPVADSHGLWFSTTDGIYLYAGGQTTKVSNLVAQVAGTCN